jgi:transposase
VRTSEHASGRRRRRIHSEQFKAEAIAACRQPGISIAAAALARQINANLLRRWVTDAERAAAGTAAAISGPAPAPTQNDGFIALALPARDADIAPIQIEIRRGKLTLIVQWPRPAMHECVVWLRDVLR